MDTSRRPDLDLATVETLSVKPLTDTLVAQLGHDTRSPYTEMFWTPILGPSTTLALRRFAFALAARGPYQVKVAELGRDLGLGGTGNHSPIRRSLKRLVQFDVATWGGGELAVRTHVPTLAPRRLAHLSPLGIEWSPVRQGMAEPAAFNAAHLSAFSLRRAQVTAAMADHRATSAKAAQVATLVTRAAKSTDHGRRRQLATWWDKATSVRLDPEILAQMLGQPREARIEADRRAEVTAHLLGPDGLTAHSSSFERRDVVRAWAEAAADGAHLAQLESLTDALVAREEVVAIAAGPSGEPRNSTAELMALEAGLIEAARSQRHAGRGMASAEVLHNALADGPDLSYEQVYMVTSLTTSGSGVEIVLGRAGTGKTFALDAARAAWQAGGHRVIGTSLAARAAAELESGSGITSVSLVRLLIDLERPESALAPDSVVVVDEAGMVGTRDLYRLAKLTEAAKAKLVLVGDPRQLCEISAGGAFAALARELGASELTHNRRQEQSWEKHALAELRSGNVVKAVDRYQAAGRINTAPSARAARAAGQRLAGGQGPAGSRRRRCLPRAGARHQGRPAAGTCRSAGSGDWARHPVPVPGVPTAPPASPPPPWAAEAAWLAWAAVTRRWDGVGRQPAKGQAKLAGAPNNGFGPLTKPARARSLNHLLDWCSSPPSVAPALPPGWDSSPSARASCAVGLASIAYGRESHSSMAGLHPLYRHSLTTAGYHFAGVAPGLQL